MKTTAWLAVNRNGVVRLRKNKPDMVFDEVAVRLELTIPNEMFIRPHIAADIRVEGVQPVEVNPEIVLNTKELIEQQSGVKIDFRLLPVEEETEDGGV